MKRWEILKTNNIKIGDVVKVIGFEAYSGIVQRIYNDDPKVCQWKDLTIQSIIGMEYHVMVDEKGRVVDWDYEKDRPIFSSHIRKLKSERG